jgi:4-carboxymuconolactone decarboxylase
MARLAPLTPKQMTEKQRRIHDVVARTRKGSVGGPFSVWYRVPELAEPANLLHNAFRLNGTMDRRLFEMLILLVAHKYGAKYVWSHHVNQALKAGLARSTIDAIAGDREPRFEQHDEKFYYDVIQELLDSKTLRDATYREALSHLGEALLIEVVTAVGFYSMVSLVVNTFDVDPPAHATA